VDFVPASFREFCRPQHNHWKLPDARYDELNSSHLTVHGATDQAIAAGFTMINISSRYLSPDMNKQNPATDAIWNTHHQPRDAQLAIDKVRQLSRRSRTGDTGYAVARAGHEVHREKPLGQIVYRPANTGIPFRFRRCFAAISSHLGAGRVGKLRRPALGVRSSAARTPRGYDQHRSCQASARRLPSLSNGRGNPRWRGRARIASH
jgi:hypothetical protein